MLVMVLVRQGWRSGEFAGSTTYIAEGDVESLEIDAGCGLRAWEGRLVFD